MLELGSLTKEGAKNTLTTTYDSVYFAKVSAGSGITYSSRIMEMVTLRYIFMIVIIMLLRKIRNKKQMKFQQLYGSL